MPWLPSSALRTGFALVLAILVAACSKGSEGPSTPTPTPANVNGTWAGSASDSSGDGQMTWTLTQTASSFSGIITMSDRASGATGRGSVSGSVSGTSVQFSLTIPSGGFDPPNASCSATVSGTATASTSALSGTYTGSVSGSDSCAGAITSGQFNLNKQ